MYVRKCLRSILQMSILFCNMQNGNFVAHLIINLRDLFHVYLNIFEFHFLRLHINKTNKYCFFMHIERVPGIDK